MARKLTSRPLGATLAALKLKLQTAGDFMEPWGHFHDHVAMESIHRRIGRPAVNPRLEGCLAAIAGALYKRPGAAHGTWFLHLAEHRFWHGSTTAAGRVAICFYFDDIEMGLAGFMKSLHSRQVDLARLRLVPLPATASGWRGQAGSARCN